MTGQDRADDETLVERLKDAQAARCAYGTREGDGRTCDCKYAWPVRGTSEQTGCPELRAAIQVLGGDRPAPTTEDAEARCIIPYAHSRHRIGPNVMCDGFDGAHQ